MRNDEQEEKFIAKAEADAMQLRTALAAIGVETQDKGADVYTRGFDTILGSESLFIECSIWRRRYGYRACPRGVKIRFGDYGDIYHREKKDDAQFDFPTIAAEIKSRLERAAAHKILRKQQAAESERIAKIQADEFPKTDLMHAARRSDGKYEIRVNQVVTLEKALRIQEILAQ